MSPIANTTAAAVARKIGERQAGGFAFAFGRDPGRPACSRRIASRRWRRVEVVVDGPERSGFLADRVGLLGAAGFRAHRSRDGAGGALGPA